MSDPHEELEPLSAWSQQLIAAEQQRPVDVTAAASRVAQALQTSLGAPFGAAAGAGTAAATALGAKAIVAGLALFVAGGAVGSAVTWQLAVARQPVAQPLTVVMAPVEATPPPPAPAVESPPPPAPPGTPPKRVAHPSQDQLASEALLIEQARTALLNGQPADALASLEQHRARYPAGQMLEEREALTVRALVAVGRREEANAAFARFAAAHPGSALIPALRKIVTSD